MPLALPSPPAAGAGSSGSAVKSRRPKGRTPLPAHSPAFTSSSAASMAWSPYPSSAAEASTTFRGAPPPVPSSATPTLGPAGLASAASESPGASVAADLRSRLNIGGDGAAATSTGSLLGKLQDRLHLGGDQQAAAQPAAAQPAAPAAPFSFVFGTAAAAGVPSPKAGRAAHRKPSPRSSPASGTRPSSAAAPAAAFQRAGSMSSTAATPEAAPAALAAGQGPATQQAAPGAFVFGASGGSPAALRAHHRARQHSQSPSQTPSPGKAAAAAAATAPGATSEPLQASNQQPPPQPPQPQQKHGWFGPFVRLGNLGKMGSSSGSPTPGFAAAGTTARRPPSTRKKSGPPVRSPPRPTSGGMAAAAAPPPAAPAAPPAAAAAPPPPAPAGPADGAAGAQERDAPTKTAYNCCEMYRSQVGNTGAACTCALPAVLQAALPAATHALHASARSSPPAASILTLPGQRGLPRRRLQRRIRPVHQGADCAVALPAPAPPPRAAAVQPRRRAAVGGQAVEVRGVVRQV